MKSQRHNREFAARVYTLDAACPHSPQLIASGDRPMNIHCPDLCGDDTVVLHAVIGDGECGPKIGYPVKACGGRFFASSSQSNIITPWPGIFVLHYTGEGSIRFSTQLMPYPYNFDMMKPLCCNEVVEIA